MAPSPERFGQPLDQSAQNRIRAKRSKSRRVNLGNGRLVPVLAASRSNDNRQQEPPTPINQSNSQFRRVSRTLWRFSPGIRTYRPCESQFHGLPSGSGRVKYGLTCPVTNPSIASSTFSRSRYPNEPRPPVSSPPFYQFYPLSINERCLCQPPFSDSPTRLFNIDSVTDGVAWREIGPFGDFQGRRHRLARGMNGLRWT